MRFTLKPLVIAALCSSSAVWASSHREAPLITETPKVDGTDLYMFNSYETGRTGFVTLIANYQPLQDPYGGPNYFTMDPDALYEIHIDNSGDSKEDITFQFRFTNTYKGLAIPTGAPSGNVGVPLTNIGAIDAAGAALNVEQSYTLTVVRGDRRTSTNVSQVTDSAGATKFPKPADNIGTKSIPDYAAYANGFIKSFNFPGCSAGAGSKVFVGQRREGFVVNLGQVFDLVNLNPLGARNSAKNIISDKNITSLALEVPAACLTAGADPVIGAWTTASLRQSRVLNPSPTGPAATATAKGPTVEGGAWTQVSRLGHPLVNEVVIGLNDKDKFNASQPKDDVANFGTYVLYPTLPVLVNILFPGATTVPPVPRNDLLAVFVTGVTTGATQTPASFKYTAPANQTVGGEMERLNTAIPATPAGSQKDLGFLDCDLAGFPNGRRPIDDVVDIELTVVEGALSGLNGVQTCDLSSAAGAAVKNPGVVVNDGARPNPADYLVVFPYLNTPIPGSTTAVAP